MGYRMARAVVAVATVVGVGVAAAGSASAEGSGGARAAAPAAAPTARGGIVLDGIAGEGRAIAGGIDVASYSEGVSVPSGGSGGGGAGKPSFTDLQVSGVLDAAYPALFLTSATGRHVKGATLTACTDANKCAASAYAQIVLTDVVITKVVVSGDRQVDFSLGYARIAWRFLRDGKVVSESQFDLRTNTG